MSRASRYAAACAIAVAAAVLFGPALWKGEIFTVRDHTDYFQPLHFFTAAHLRAGQLPLWNAYSASGEPWLANPQTGVFYPPAWLFLILPFATAYVLYLALHSLILGGGTYLMVRDRASNAAAAASAVALMMSGPVVSLLDVSNNYTTFAWLPLIVWRARRDRTDDASARIAALLLAMAFLAGEPFFAAIAAVVYAAIVRRPWVIATAGTGAAALVAIQALPFLEMLRTSDRVGGFDAAEILRESFRGSDYWRLILPPRLASLIPVGEQFIAVPYAGVIVLLLALAGVATMLRRGQASRLAGSLILIAAALAIAAGPAWLARLPVTLFRYPARVLPFALLPLLSLVAAGVDGLFTRKSAPRVSDSSKEHRPSGNSPVVLAALVIAIGIDLFPAVRPLLATGPYSSAPVPFPREVGHDGKIVRLMSGRELSRREARLSWIAGYLNLNERRFDAWTAAPAVSRGYARLYTRSLSKPNALRMLGVRFVLAPAALAPPFRGILRSGDVVVNELAPSLPHAFVPTAGGVQAAEWIDWQPSRVTVSMMTATGGMLVVTQNDAPGWSVTVDGHAARGRRFLDVFRAVEIPPGKHKVVWIYRPKSLLLGAVLTMLGVVWIVLGMRPRHLQRASRV